MEAEALEPLDPESQARFDAVVGEIQKREKSKRSAREIWHAHHWPDEYDRCMVIAGRHICRRCLILYPAALAVAVLSLSGVTLWPRSLDLWFIWGLCLPASGDFVLEQLGVIRYSARRQVITTALLAPALGRGFGHELAQTWSWEFWGPVFTFCTVWFVAALIGWQRRQKV
jgi:DNA-directed RNA polymerase subunit N (RpoN/RPB10)